MTDLLERCETEMRYAGWTTLEVDNPQRQELYFRVQAALAQPAQEPVAWLTKNKFSNKVDFDAKNAKETTGWSAAFPVYTTPQQRTWVGLTDEERDAITNKVIGFNNCCGWEDDYAKTVEAKLKEKNT
jgi:hypothetical protein